MKNVLSACILFIALIISGCNKSKTQIGEMKFPKGTVQHVVRANEINWKPCPPNIPGDCEMAVLEGNPKNNEMFTVRFKINDDFALPPHTHPKDERVTVLKGKVFVAFGKGTIRKNAKEFGQGDYYVNARN